MIDKFRLVKGGVYRLGTRGSPIGVYDGDHYFIRMRSRGGKKFLDITHTSLVDSVDLLTLLPEGIPIQVHEPGTFTSCAECCSKVEWSVSGNTWTCENECRKASPISPPNNKKLLDFLREYELAKKRKPFPLAPSERSMLIDAVMTHMSRMEEVPQNDLSEMPDLQALLDRLMFE